MSWDALAAIAQSVGAVTVVVMLVFLLVQLRQLAAQTQQNARALKFSTYGERAAQLSGWLQQTALDQELSRIIHAAGRAREYGDESMEAVAWMRLSLALRSVFIIHEDLFYQCEAGAIDRSFWVHRSAWLKQLVAQNPAFRGWWERERASGAYIQAFIAAVDAAEPSIPGGHAHSHTLA